MSFGNSSIWLEPKLMNPNFIKVAITSRTNDYMFVWTKKWRRCQKKLIRGTNTKYIPTNLGSFSNLTVLVMVGTQFEVEIKAKDFHGMQNLKEISLSNNKFSSVPLDVFATLTKLRIH